MEDAMTTFFSYLMSHMYDIHAIIAAAVVVALMSYIKVPVKRKLADMAEHRRKKKGEAEEAMPLLLRRYHSLLIVLVFVLSVPVFAVLSLLSPFILFTWPSSLLTGIFALCIYAFWEQITEPSGREEETV